MKKYLILFFMVQNSFAFIPGYYQPSVQGIRDVEMPDKGWGVYWYNSFYYSDRPIDINGDEADPKKYGVPTSRETTAYTTYPYLYWMPGIDLFGGSLGFSLNMVLGHITLTSYYPLADETRSDKNFSLGDMAIAPIILAWDLDNFFGVFNLFLGLPISKHDPNDRDNVGLGYFAVVPQLGGMYYFDKEHKNALMMILTFEIKTEVRNSDVRPADVFSFEFGYSRFFTKHLSAGATAFYQAQVNYTAGIAEEFSKWKQQAGAIGLEASYWFKPDIWGLTFKYNWEYMARAGFQGRNFVLNIYFNKY